MKKIFLIFALLLLLGLSVIFIGRFVLNGGQDTWICVDNQWVKDGNPQTPMPKEGCRSEVINEEPGGEDPAGGTKRAGNFFEIGNLTKPDNEWRLVYEEPGKPALNVTLEFDENSICSAEVCDPVKLQVGDRVEVVGERNEDVVKVFELNAPGTNNDESSAFE